MQTTDDLVVTGSAVFRGTVSAGPTSISAQTRSTGLVQDNNVRFPEKLTDLRVWDALHTNLPGTAAADDLALINGTLGSVAPTVQAGDLKAAGATTRYAGLMLVVPECYVSGETVQLILSCGMLTTIADTSCTVDVEAYKLDKVGGVSADLCATAAQSINSLVFAEKTFTITATTLNAGDVLICRIALTCTDAATATAVKPTIASIDPTYDIKG